MSLSCRSGQAFLFVLLASCLATAEDRRTDKGRVVIMSLNAEFLWDGLAPEEGQVNFAWKGAPDEAADHMKDVAQIIIDNNPDIVVLIEVESLVALQKFNTDHLAGRRYVPYLVKGKDTYTGQDVGLLTRVDPDDGQVHRENRTGTSGSTHKSVSKNLYAKITVGDIKIGLVGLHFLARPSASNRKEKRQAQADAMRQRAIDLSDDGYLPVVVGDFNDYDGAAGSRDHQDSMPITNVLSLLRGMKANDPNDNLYNVCALVPKADRYTAHWDKNDNDLVTPNELTSIDHILVAPQLVPLIQHVAIAHNHNPVEVTDHFPVIVHLKTTPPAGQAGSLKIDRLMPNPSGDERQNEYVVLKNTGTSAVSLTGWKLRDKANTTWALSGSVPANGELKIMRAGKQMALNNSGDTVDLIAPDNSIADTVTYPRVAEEEVVEAG